MYERVGWARINGKYKVLYPKPGYFFREVKK